MGFRHSLCHGWASGPTAFMIRNVLGFRILEPGCRKLEIKPDLGDLEWAEGTFPTPLGAVRVRHDRNADGSISTKVLEKPEGVEVVLTCEGK